MPSRTRGDRVSMTAATGAREQQSVYFFLSYAHSAASAELTGSSADQSVSRFFSDLRAAVAEAAGAPGGQRIAFYDQEIPSLSDLKASLSQALGQAEVFVPLYSPKYFELPWPLRERE